MRYVYVRCANCNHDYGIDVDRLDIEIRGALTANQTAAVLLDMPHAAAFDSEALRCPYPACRPQYAASYRYRYRSRNAQVGASEAAAVAVHPGTGEVVYCFANPSDPLPERYAAQGFEKQQFHSLAALRGFCNARGLVNDIEYDNPHDGMTEESARAREEWERTKSSKYERERRLAQQAIDDERRRKRR